MAPRDKPHILVPIVGEAQNFRPARGRGGPRPSDVDNRGAHAQAILDSLEALRPAAERAGAYIALTGRPEEPIDAQKFNSSGLFLLNVRQAGDEPGVQGELLFFAPREALTRLEAKVEAFRHQDAPA